jgi:hypothetical protein
MSANQLLRLDREKVQLTIGVTGTINVGVMTVGSLVLDVLHISLEPA